jgi:hypothetical protein
VGLKEVVMCAQGVAYRLLWIIALILLIIVDAEELIAQNIVSNSGFEMGEVGKLPEEWHDQKEGGAEGRVILTDEEAHSGKKCLFIEHTNEIGYIHPNKGVEIEPGDYSFSFWARSDTETHFSAQIYYETDWSTVVDESCNLEKGEWTKFEFPVSSLEKFPGSIQIGLTVPGRLWLDDVELVRKEGAKKIANIRIWDTLSPFLSLQDRTDWKIVPAGQATHESPLKSQGDVILENEYLTVAFCSESGKVIVYSKSGEKRAELTPLQLKGQAGSITSCKILRNTDDEATVEVHFSAEEMRESLSAVFSFSKKQIIEVKPSENMKGVSLLSPIEFAIVPSFISDDLVFDPRNYPSTETLYIPSEHLFLGLPEGEGSMLIITWPKGKQDMRQRNLKSQVSCLKSKEGDGRFFESVDFENDGKSVYLAILDAPGIWHKEELRASYLEKDVPIDWKRPFPAKWITQLYEDGVRTEYTFKESESKEGGYWRAGIGWFTYPVWFKGENAFYHLSKKIPPKGESLIYCLERKGTPISISTPADIMKQTLDNQTYESIIDSEGRRNRSLYRPDCVIGGATCGVTDRLKPIFEAGEEVEKKEYIKGGTEDMIYFLTEERQRAEEYQDFAHEMMEFLALTKEDKPELKPFLDRIEDIAREIIAAYEHEKENIKEIEYAEKLAKETQALTQRENPDNFAAFMKLKGEWTGMGGAVDDLNRKLHTLTRKLFQEAGYSCVGQRETVEIAEEIRRRTMKCLRRPGNYEIWSNY